MNFSSLVTILYVDGNMATNYYTLNNMEYIGRFSLGTKVMISDPCYGINTLCQGVLKNIRAGFWDAYIKMCDESTWGNRVAELIAISLDYNDEYEGINCSEINEPQSFKVGVDSGTAGIFDYDYYCKYHNESNANDEWYNKQICEQFSPSDDSNDLEQSIFTEFNGVVSKTRNGGYDCFIARNDEGEIIGIKIVYINDLVIEQQ